MDLFYILRSKEETYYVKKQDFMIIRDALHCSSNLCGAEDYLIKCKAIQENHLIWTFWGFFNLCDFLMVTNKHNN